MTFRTQSVDDRPADHYVAFLPAIKAIPAVPATKNTPAVEAVRGDNARRVGVPADHAGTLADAVAWAQGRGATNLVVLTGPKSKTVETLVWRRDAAPVTTVVVTTDDGRRWTVRPELLVAA